MQGPVFYKGKAGYKKYYASIRNKKFKYYKDPGMKTLGGVLDFDRLQCMITIEDEQSMRDDDWDQGIV